ncbi:MAG TPA: hypothetical protein VG937_36185 [Polyangiaceae bacterium]|nr:hypothetical protein [Polyangiaceae bacterium]
MLALLTVRCGSKTFDLLPESDAGRGGNSDTGGKANSNKGGTSGVGDNSGGRAMGGKAAGGFAGAGAPPLGGFPSLTGGRPSSNGGGVGQCATDPDCALFGSARFCDQGFCVECKNGDSNQCNFDRLRNICNVKKDICVECTGPQHCDDPYPACNSQGSCVECVDDFQCTKEPRTTCDTQHFRCVECMDENDCRDPKFPRCDMQFHTCVECTKPSDCQFAAQSSGWCAGNKVCACDTGNDAQCAGSPFGPHCIAMHCAECGSQYPCPDGQMCDPTGKCVMH